MLEPIDLAVDMRQATVGLRDDLLGIAGGREHILAVFFVDDRGQKVCLSAVLFKLGEFLLCVVDLKHLPRPVVVKSAHEALVVDELEEILADTG